MPYLKNLDKIGKERFTLIAFPLNIIGAEASPVRAVAVGVIRSGTQRTISDTSVRAGEDASCDWAGYSRSQRPSPRARLESARAEDHYPSRVITIVVPLTPGTAIDIQARLYADAVWRNATAIRSSS